MRASCITFIVFSEDDFTPDKQLRAAQEAFRFIEEQNSNEITGGYVASVTPIDPPKAVMITVPEPPPARESRK